MKILPWKWVFDEKTEPQRRRCDSTRKMGGLRQLQRWIVELTRSLRCSGQQSSGKGLFSACCSQRPRMQTIRLRHCVLNAGIPDDCEYFVEPPTGLNKPRGFVCKLRKVLCGLRKSPIFWYETMRPEMERLGFTPVSADFCLLYHKDWDALLVLYVDHFIVGTKSTETAQEIRDALGSRFKLKELGEVKRFLGFDILRTDQTRRSSSHRKHTPRRC